MDILLLGAAAVVLLLLTVWIVWRPDSRDTASDTQEAAPAPPQPGEFEDEYTSATADLSAGGVAVSAAAASAADAAEVASASARSIPPPTEMSIAQTVTTPAWPAEPIRRTAVDDAPRPAVTPARVGLGAAGLLVLGGAVAGAWLYARLQRERNKPLNRLRRRFR
jgi:hypothetical protein